MPSHRYTLKKSTVQQILKIDISVPECKDNSSGTSGTETFNTKEPSVRTI